MLDFFPFPVETSFRNFPIPASAFLKGVSLGAAGGGCVGVRLYLNYYELNTKTVRVVADSLRQVYFGDSQNQTQELLAGVWSPIIYCTDVSQVYVRNNSNSDPNPNLQVWIYTRANEK